MNRIIQKANAVFLGLLMACGIGLSVSNMRKAVADHIPGCPDQWGTDQCPPGYAPYRYPVQLPGTACSTSTTNSLDCCLYNRWRRDCILIDGGTETVGVYYSVLIGKNAFKDCQQGRCVSF
jgi:hypothetical protein